VTKRKIPLAVTIPGIGDRIRLAREFRNLTQSQFARELGLTPAAVNQWEKGTTEPGIEHMLRFRREHQIPLDWIYAADTEVLRPPFLRFIVDYGARPDAPEIARRLRREWGHPVPLAESGVAADEVAGTIARHHPPRRGRPPAPRRTLHEDAPKLDD